MNKIRIKVNVDMDNIRAGTELNIPTDYDGIPLSRYWRDKLKDSKKDNCCEIVKPKSKPKAQEKVNDQSK